MLESKIRALLSVELSADQERRFLDVSRDLDIQRTRVILLASVPPLTFFAFADPSFTTGFLLFSLLALRTLGLITGLYTWYATRHHPERFRASLRVWFFTIILLVLLVRITRPPAQFPATIWNFIALVLMYNLPLTFKERVFGVSAITLSEVMVWFMESILSDLPISTFYSIFLALGLSHIIGFFLVRDKQLTQRAQFALLERAQEAQAKAERAMADLEVLRGIIPVCMYCKKVRNDAGAYEPIVDYVRAHSGVEFSHGICPDCGERHFPGLTEEELGKVEEAG